MRADVGLGFQIGGGGDGDARHVGKHFGELAERAIIGAKIMAPLADAMGLVDGDQRKRAIAQAHPGSSARTGLRARGTRGQGFPRAPRRATRAARRRVSWNPAAPPSRPPRATPPPGRPSARSAARPPAPRPGAASPGSGSNRICRPPVGSTAITSRPARISAMTSRLQATKIGVAEHALQDVAGGGEGGGHGGGLHESAPVGSASPPATHARRSRALQPPPAQVGDGAGNCVLKHGRRRCADHDVVRSFLATAMSASMAFFPAALMAEGRRSRLRGKEGLRRQRRRMPLRVVRSPVRSSDVGRVPRRSRKRCNNVRPTDDLRCSCETESSPPSALSISVLL